MNINLIKRLLGNILNEETMQSFLDRLDSQLDYILANEVYDRFENDYDDFVSTYSGDYDYYGDEDNNDSEEDDESVPSRESEEFKNYRRDRIKDLIVGSFNSIEKNGNNLILYRMLSFKDNYLEHLSREGKHLGIYWSWDEATADVYNSSKYGEVRYLLKAEVSENGVDWLKSACLNIYDADTGEYTEHEIRLIKGTPLKILSIETDGEELNISSLKNKIFYA